jgi:hypothetical protein
MGERLASLEAPFETARAGKTSFLENQRMFLTRNGYLEETFFTFSLSPVRDETGGISGLFHPVTETTATILAGRRTRALRDLTIALNSAKDPAELIERSVQTLAAFEFDLPALAFYAFDDSAKRYRLAGQHGLIEGSQATPKEFVPDAPAPWPVGALVERGAILEYSAAADVLRGSIDGPYDEPAETAFLLPISVPGAGLPPIIVIAGASPRLPLDEAYRGFFDLVAAALAAALASVRALADERRRSQALAESIGRRPYSSLTSATSFAPP